MSLLYLIKDLRERYKIKPYVIIPEEGEFCKQLKKEDIPYLATKFYFWRINQEDLNYKYILKQIFMDGIAVAKSACWIHNNDIALVHSNSSTICLGAKLAKVLGIPHIWHIREYGKEDYNIDYIYSDVMVKRYYEAATAVLAISKDLMNYNKRNLNLSKMSLVYNGIDDKYQIRKNNCKEDKVHFCTVGLISENKNQLEAVKACKRLLEEGLDNFDYTIVGGGEKKEIRKIEYYVKRNALENTVKILGYTNGISDILKNMDVGIISSKCEAFGRVTVEYMLNYMPVIGAKSGGTKELVRDERNGLLYKSGCEKDLAQKMKKFINKKPLINKYGMYARAYAKKNFSLAQNTDKIYQIYCDML